MSDQRNPESSEEAIQVGQRDIFEKFGILFTDVKEGRASSEMTLKPQHRNVYGMPYGGIMFHLADITSGIHAVVKKAGKNLFFIDADISDDSGSVLSEYSFVFTNLSKEA